MSAVDVEALRALLAAAAPGPWECHGSAVDGAYVLDKGWQFVAEARGELGEQHAAIIAALRNHAEALLDAYEDRERLRDSHRLLAEELGDVSCQLDDAGVPVMSLGCVTPEGDRVRYLRERLALAERVVEAARAYRAAWQAVEDGPTHGPEMVARMRREREAHLALLILVGNAYDAPEGG